MADIPTGIWLFRHGKTQMNSSLASKDYIRGWLNVPLDAEGKKEAAETAAFIDRYLQPIEIFSSDLDRAAMTAKTAAQGCRCRLDITPDFRPWGLGVFQGQPAEKVVPQLQQYIDNPDKPVPGGGESFGRFRDRVLAAMQQAMNLYVTTGRNVVIVTHFRVLKLIQAWISHPNNSKGSEIDAAIFAANDIPTGGVLLVERARGRWRAQIRTRPKVGVRLSGEQP